MKVVLKYEIYFAETTCIEVPVGAKVRHFDMQGDQFYVWIEIPQGVAEKSVYRFNIRATGEPFSGGLYINTIQSRDGFVWHAYQI